MVTEPLLPALMKPLLDGSFGAQAHSLNPWLVPFVIVGIFLLRGVLGFLGDYAMVWVSNKVVMDLRNAMFIRMVNLPTRFFDNQSAGSLMSKIATSSSPTSKTCWPQPFENPPSRATQLVIRPIFTRSSSWSKDWG